MRHSPEILRYVPPASTALLAGVSLPGFQAAVQMHVANSISNAQTATETAARMAASPHAAAWSVTRALYQDGAGPLSAKACALAVAAFLLEHGTYPAKPVVASWAAQTHNGVPLGIASTATRLAFVADAETAALSTMLADAGVPLAAGAARSAVVAAATDWFKGMASGDGGGGAGSGGAGWSGGGGGSGGGGASDVISLVIAPLPSAQVKASPGLVTGSVLGEKAVVVPVSQVAGAAAMRALLDPPAATMSLTALAARSPGAVDRTASVASGAAAYLRTAAGLRQAALWFAGKDDLLEAILPTCAEAPGNVVRGDMRGAFAGIADSDGNSIALPIAATMSLPVRGDRTTPSGVALCLGRAVRVLAVLLDTYGGAPGDAGVPAHDGPTALVAARDLSYLFEQVGDGLEVAIARPSWRVVALEFESVMLTLLREGLRAALRVAADAFCAGGGENVRATCSLAGLLVLAPGLGDRINQVMYAHAGARAGGGFGDAVHGEQSNSAGAQLPGPAARPDSWAVAVNKRWAAGLPPRLRAAPILRLSKAAVAGVVPAEVAATQPCFLAVLGIGACGAALSPPGEAASAWRVCTTGARIHPPKAVCDKLLPLITAATE